MDFDAYPHRHRDSHPDPDLDGQPNSHGDLHLDFDPNSYRDLDFVAIRDAFSHADADPVAADGFNAYSHADFVLNGHAVLDAFFNNDFNRFLDPVSDRLAHADGHLNADLGFNPRRLHGDPGGL